MEIKKLYALRVDREDVDISIKLIKENNHMFNNFKDCIDSKARKIYGYDVYNFNNIWYASYDRKEIKKLAIEFKEKWIEEIKSELLKIELIKI